MQDCESYTEAVYSIYHRNNEVLILKRKSGHSECAEDETAIGQGDDAPRKHERNAEIIEQHNHRQSSVRLLRRRRYTTMAKRSPICLTMMLAVLKRAVKCVSTLR